MFKLVIVEDEDNIRQSLERYIPWADLGFQVVGTFSDGSDAFAFLKDNPCDAVLTDLLMSRMSGLELIRNLYELQPQLKVVILSGHSEFAFAQQAIKYQVAHYLVKPVDEDELIAVFQKLADQLAEQKAEQTVAESRNRELQQVLQKSFLRDLLSGRVASVNELDVYLKLLGQKYIQSTCPMFAFEIRTMGRTMDVSAETITAEEIFQAQLTADHDVCHIFFMEDRANHWQVVFIGFAAGTDLRKYCNRKMQQLTAALNAGLGGEFTFCLTHSVAQLTELLTDIDAPETRAEKQPMDGALCENVVSDYKLLIVELDLGSKAALEHLLDGILFKLKNAPLENVQFTLKNLYSVVELDYRKRKINVWDITGGKFNFNHLYRVKSMEAIATCLKEDFFALCEGLKHCKVGSEHSVVGRLIQYINEHLDEDVSHNTIAAKYRIHPGYMSRLFKQEMGETLSEYLLRIRIERAAALLKEGHHKIGDIAGMVGYSASSYFSIMFKKYTGFTPREYSQRVSL